MIDTVKCQLSHDEILNLNVMALSNVTVTFSSSDAPKYTKTIGDFVRSIQTPSEQKTKARAAYGTDDYDNLKKALPVWINGGTGGTKQDTINPNGLVTIDIDHIEGYETAVKTRLCELPFIAICSLSISGHGVYALAYAPDYAGDGEGIKTHIYEVINAYLTATCGTNIACDPSCTDISRKRFEPFDPAPYIANKVCTFEPIDRLIERKWQKSTIKKLATMMGYDGETVTPNHASVGALLAISAASARLTLWDRDIITPHETYQARIGCVVLGDTGAGKKRIDSAIQIIADKLNCQCGNNKSTADMAYRASLSCNFTETNDTTKKTVWKPKKVCEITPYIEVNDEVYATIELNKTAQYAMDKAAQRRLLLDSHYNPQTTKKDPLPEYKFTPCYQYVCFSQYDSYAAAMAGERTDTGDGRRELPFQLPKIDTDGMSPAVAMFRARLSTPSSDLDGVYDAIDAAYKHNQARIHSTFDGELIERLTVREIEGASKYTNFPALDYESRPLCQFTFFRCLEGLSQTHAKDAFTHIANIATISAYLSQNNSITTSDILTAAAITRECFGLRDTLQARSEEIELSAGCDRQIQWLTKYWAQEEKIVKLSNYKKAKTNNGIGLLPATQAIVTQWETANLITLYEGDNKRVRRASPQEVEQISNDMAIAAQIQTKANADLARITTDWDTQHDRAEQFAARKRPPFADDTHDAQKIRVIEMINKCLSNGRCGAFVKGQRETTLYRLRNVLDNNGMWGTLAKDLLTQYGKDAGLPDKEIKHALR
jgi:hypothetical protein